MIKKESKFESRSIERKIYTNSDEMNKIEQIRMKIMKEMIYVVQIII